MSLNRALRWMIGSLIVVPLIVIGAFFGYLSYQSWAALETVSVNTFGEGEILEVTRIASGPIGSGYAYELGHRINAEAELELVDVWEYPSGDHQVQIYELKDLAVVITPARNVLHIRTQSGSWKHWRIRGLLAIPSLSADLLRDADHQPRMVIQRIDSQLRKIYLRIEYTSRLAQHVVLEPSETGQAVNVTAITVPSDPCVDYATRFQLEANSKLLFIEWDLNGDDITEFLVSHESARNGRAGNIWTVYVAGKDGFAPLNDTLSMRTDTTSKWTPKVASTVVNGITTYHPGSGRQGVLVTYSIEKGRLTTVNTPVRPADSSENSYLAAMAQENLIPISAVSALEAVVKLQQE
ncbi:MAG: hypothetical protein ACR2PZ_26460 [Pseudomonadales bacterium]